MVWFLAFSVGFWGLGYVLKAPKSARWLMIGLLYLAVLLAQFSLPETNAVRLTLGGSPGEWVVLGMGAALILGYRRLLNILKNMAPKPQASPSNKNFSTGELDRYARHIVLREIGGSGQKRLKSARVLVVGAGGLGSAALQYLAAAGVGTIGVIDDDIVDNSNLQRQVIHTDARIGMAKVFSAQAAMLAQNPGVDVRPYNRRLTPENASDLIGEYDLVLDGSDNLETRYLVNRICTELGKPLVAAALSQWESQLSTYDAARETPCYQCIFPEAPSEGLAPNCAEAGVLGPLPGVVGAMMAVEAVKEITGAGTGLRGRMMLYDALHGENRVITLKRRPDCPICGTRAAGDVT